MYSGIIVDLRATGLTRRIGIRESDIIDDLRRLRRVRALGDDQGAKPEHVAERYAVDLEQAERLLELSGWRYDAFLQAWN